jgi:hypothetical protein
MNQQHFVYFQNSMIVGICFHNMFKRDPDNLSLCVSTYIKLQSSDEDCHVLPYASVKDIQYSISVGKRKLKAQ